MTCEDQALVHTTVCVDWKCKKANGWIKPELIKDSQGFWCCPVCKKSYGVDAVKNDDSVIQQTMTQTKHNQFIQKAIETIGGTYNPDAAAHLIAKDGTVSYIMKSDVIQGLTCDLVTLDEMAIIKRSEK